MVLAIGIDYILTMRRNEITAVGLLGGLLFSTGVKAVVTDAKENPYNVIIERNVFGIKPPLPPPVPPPINVPAPEVKLAGITTIVDPPRAIIHWKEPPKPGTPPGKEESYIFREGEQQGIIKVLAINVKDGSVKIENAGEPLLLTFETHGAKLPNTPAPAVPGAPPGATLGATPFRPGAIAPVNPTASLNRGTPVYNRLGANPNPSPGVVNPGNSSLPSIPPRQLRGFPNTPNSPETVAQQHPPLNPEAQIILMEVERERTKAQVAAGELPPIPPTELTPGTPEGQ